jgi:hypothetical protein
VVQNFKLQYFTGGLLDGVNAGVAKFKYFTAVGANQVIVLPVAVGPLVLGLVFAKLVFTYQVALHQ